MTRGRSRVRTRCRLHIALPLVRVFFVVENNQSSGVHISFFFMITLLF